MKIIAALAVVALVVVAVPSPAHAIGDKRAAAAHFQKGRALFDANNFSAALEEFQLGYDSYPLPGFLVNIGQCQRKLDRLDEAAAAFQHYLDSEATDPKIRGEVQDALAEIQGERDRRLAADLEARRQRDEAERRHPLEEEPARAVATPAPRAVPTAAMPAVTATAPAAASESHAQKGPKKWVWAVVGVLAVGVAASAVAVGVVETQPAAARPGSLGLLDGRR